MEISDSGKSGVPTLAFIHGWPDTAELWDAQVAHFSPEYRCIRFTLPNFGERPSGGKAGYDFPELAKLLADEIRKRRNADQKVFIVGHDWGAYLTYHIERDNPDLMDGLITMDVGAHMKPETWGHTFFLISYQWWLTAAYFIGKLIPSLGDWMTRKCSLYMRAPRRERVYARSNYLYFYYWRARFFRKYSASILRRYIPMKPILFLYGERKPYPFHSDMWIKIVEGIPGSKVVAMPKSGHWLQVKEPVLTNQLMESWLSKTKRP